MSRRPTVTKEAIVESAFQIVRAQGHEALTARSLASSLGCSTQPIMYQFPSLSELRDLVYQQADAYHTRHILAGSSLLEMGMRYIQFAAEEPMLFRLLFQSGHFDGTSLQNLIRAPESAPLLAATGPTTGSNPEATARSFEALFVAVHGYASLIANNAMPFDPAEIRQTLATIGNALLKGEDETC